MPSAEPSPSPSSAAEDRPKVLYGFWRAIRIGRDDRFASRALLWVGIPFGLLLVLLVPPTQVVDEAAHFLRTWQLAGLNLVTDPQIDTASGQSRNGSVFDVCVVEYVDEFEAVAATEDDFALGDVWFDTPDCSPMRRDWVVTDASVNYGPWSYPGQVIGLAVGRALGLPLPITFHLGRVVGLAVYLGAIYAALRITPAGRLAMLFVALVPMSMLTAAAYSADGTILAAAILAVACALRLRLGRSPTDLDAGPRRQLSSNPRVLFGLLTLATFCIVMSKPVYVVFVGLFALVPVDADPSVRRPRAWILGTPAAIVLLSGLWFKLSKGSSTQVFYEGADAGAQVRALIREPLGFFDLLWDTLNSFTYEIWFFRAWSGVFGMMRNREGIAVILGYPYLLLAVVVGALAVGAEAGQKRIIPRMEAVTRGAVSWVILVLGPLLLFVGAFVLWTPPDGDIIVDVQGRYILPFVPVAAGAIALFRERSTLAVSPLVVAIGTAVLALGSLDTIRALFY